MSEEEQDDEDSKCWLEGRAGMVSKRGMYIAVMGTGTRGGASGGKADQEADEFRMDATIAGS